MGRSLPARPCCSHRAEAERKEAGDTLLDAAVESFQCLVYHHCRIEEANSPVPH